MCNFANKKDMSRNDKIKTCILSVALVILIAFLVCGCRTTRYVPVETIVRDTTTLAHWDSIVNERVRLVKDSLMSFRWEQRETSAKDSLYVKDDVKERVDQNGNVIGRDSTHIEYRYIENKTNTSLKDSINHLARYVSLSGIYKKQRDSLNKVLSETQTKVEHKEAELVGFKLICYLLGRFVFLALLVFVVGKAIIYIVKNKLHNFL